MRCFFLILTTINIVSRAFFVSTIVYDNISDDLPRDKLIYKHYYGIIIQSILHEKKNGLTEKMCQFTPLEKVEPQEIFAEKECRILQALLANITATDETKNEINTLFTILWTKTTAKIKNKKKFFHFLLEFIPILFFIGTEC